DHAHATSVLGCERVSIAQRRHLLTDRFACVHDGRALGDGRLTAVDVDRDQTRGHPDSHGTRAVYRGHETSLYVPSLSMADSTAFHAVCPSPQMEASFMT